MGNKGKPSGDGRSFSTTAEIVQPRPKGTSSIKDKERWIGKQLRQVYEVALREPVPDHLVDLLKKLDRDGSPE
jgi:hypothetical protein